MYKYVKTLSAIILNSNSLLPTHLTSKLNEK